MVHLSNLLESIHQGQLSSDKHVEKGLPPQLPVFDLHSLLLSRQKGGIHWHLHNVLDHKPLIHPFDGVMHCALVGWLVSSS